MMGAHFQVPDESELVEFFGTEPVERAVDDGYWCYEVKDERGLALRFSFNLYERSVQTVLMLSGRPVATVSHEAAERMSIREGKLRCEFSNTSSRTTLVVGVAAEVSIAWSTLRSR
jgi:hypothetical protein